jgi:TP901 family phage tail tape measure protein
MLAGDVYAILGARVDGSGFLKYDTAMGKAVAAAGRGELAQKRYDAAMAKSNANMAAVGRTAERTAKVGVAALAVGLAASVKVAANFDAAMRNVNSIAGLNEKQFKNLSTAVRGLSGKTAQAPETLAKGLYTIVSSGFDATEGMKILEAAAFSASAGLTDTETSVTALAGVLNAYRLPASEAGKMSDVLFKTVDRGVISYEQLAQSIGTVIPFAAALKVDLPQVGSAISTLTKQGIPAAEATTYLKNAMVQFLKPQKDLQSAIKKTGASSGEALVRAKGFQGALDAVTATTDGSKSALQALFPDIRATAAVLGLTGDNSKSANADLKAFGNTAGATQKVFAEQSKSASLQLRQMKVDLQNAGITIGTAFLPALTEGAKALSEWLTKAQKSGDLQKFADGLVAGGEQALDVIKDLGSGIAAIASDIAPAVGAAKDLADALGLLSPVGIEAVVAAFAGFKVAQTVAPMVATLATNVALLRTAPSGGALAADIAAMVNPYTAAAVAVAGLAAGLVYLTQKESAAEAAARRHADAMRDLKSALDDLQGSTADDADAANRRREADQQATKDRRSYAQAVKEHGKNSKEAKTASDAMVRSTIAAAVADRNASVAAQKRADDAKRSVKVASDAQRDAAKTAALAGVLGSGDDKFAANRRLAEANRALAKANAEVTLSEINKQRLLAGTPAIARKNAVAIAGLSDALEGVPEDVKTKILTEGSPKALNQLAAVTEAAKGTPNEARIKAILAGDQPVKVKLAAVAALAKGVPDAELQAILTGGGSTVAQLNSIAQAVRAIPAFKQVTIQTTQVFKQVGDLFKRAAGRGPGGSETALVGEGRHARELVIDPKSGFSTVVDRPTIMGLSESAYVIPEDPMQRGRSLGLLAMLAEDLGLRGFGRSKKASKRHKAKTKGKGSEPLGLPDPGKLRPTSLPLADLEKKETSALKSLNEAKDKVHDLPGKIRDAEKRIKDISGRKAVSKESKAKKARDLKKAKETAADLKRSLAANRKAEPRRRAEWKELRTQLTRARKYQDAITKTETLADEAASRMRLANAQGNAGAWTAARGDRGRALKTLADLLAKARGALGNQNSQAAADLAKQIADTAVDLQDNDASELDVADVRDDTFNAWEQARLAELDRDVALAELTPQTEDDQKALAWRAKFLEDLLTNAQVTGRSASVVGELAGMVKQARDDVSALTSSSQPDVSGDLQAQLDQERRRRELSDENARLNQQFLATALTGGDINTGGSGGPSIVINTLHPGDPRTLDAIGRAATAGVSLQGGVQSPRVSVG